MGDVLDIMQVTEAALSNPFMTDETRIAIIQAEAARISVRSHPQPVRDFLEHLQRLTIEDLPGRKRETPIDPSAQAAVPVKKAPAASRSDRGSLVPGPRRKNEKVPKD